MGRILGQSKTIYWFVKDLSSKFVEDRFTHNNKCTKSLFFKAPVKSSTIPSKSLYFDKTQVKFTNVNHATNFEKFSTYLEKFYGSSFRPGVDNLENKYMNALDVSFSVVSSPMNSHFSGLHSMGLPAFDFVVSTQSQMTSLEIAKSRLQHKAEYDEKHFGLCRISDPSDVLDYFDIDASRPSEGSFTQLKSYYFYKKALSSLGIVVSRPEERGLRSDIVFSNKNKIVYGDVKRLLKPLEYEVKSDSVYSYSNSNTTCINDILDLDYVARKVGESWDKDSYPSRDHVLILSIDGFPKDRSELETVAEYQQFLNNVILPQLKLKVPTIPAGGKVVISYVGAPPVGTDEEFINVVNDFNTSCVREDFFYVSSTEDLTLSSSFSKSLKLKK